jgi:preprotein translocase subunit SecA
MQTLLKKVFGTKNERDIKGMLPLVEQINRLEPEIARLADADLPRKTASFRERVAQGESLDDLLPEAFALVREAAKRTLGQRHFDVQLIGGIVLHRGTIAEMKTGEGKTLVATLAAYLNALTGRGVHVVTVNDYLAAFHAEWMGRLYRFLGLSVGCVVHGLTDQERQQAYAADVTYGQNNEFGFDYLRDNMKPSLELCVQRDPYFAIVDEVDSALIDEARTPLIISGPSEENTQVYAVANRVIPRLNAGTKGEPSKGIEETGDYWLDEKAHHATLTEDGIHKIEKLLGVDNLYDPSMLPMLHAVNQALVAHTLKKLDVDYVVKPGESGKREVIIVDEFTGRLMPGRRWSDGLHQAVEAKEGIPVQSENQTLASVTFQNYFRMYEKLAGMTGTADTEAPEFAKIYDLDVIVVPTNRPMVRDDLADVVYKTKREKFKAVVEEVIERHAKGQPILVGTISIETSEMLARALQKKGVKHNVLNAKHHGREAEIVAQAGRKDAVTISTNMAGRGTDIILGGNAEMLALSKCKEGRDDPEFASWLARFEPECAAEREEVVAAGGLHIIGTERHESRRIDNQLRGRSGRQGDPGSTRFYLALEDDLLRIFGSERITPWMERLGLEEDEAIEHRFISRAIENSQKKVEARNFDIRKHLLDYDDVMNRQRQAFYARRRESLSREDVHQEVLEMSEGLLVALLADHWPEKGDPDPEQLGELALAVEAQFGVHLDPTRPPFLMDGKPGTDRDALGHTIFEALGGLLEEKKKTCDALAEAHQETGYPSFERFERAFLLQTLDRLWKDHLHSMDGLREGINLRGYAQRDPKVEYQREGYALFTEMEERTDAQATETVFKFVLPDPVADRVPPPPVRVAAPASPGNVLERRPASALVGAAAGVAGSAGAKPGKVGRNQACPCGSGKKFKKCCGAG